MKNFSNAILSLIIVLIISDPAHSQPKKYNSDEGFWVITSNIHHKKITTVKYYQNNSTLIYEETLTGTRFNIKRTKNLMILKRGLDNSITAWNKDHNVIMHGDLVAGIMHKRK